MVECGLCDLPITVFSDSVFPCLRVARVHTHQAHTYASVVLPPQRVAWLTAFGLTLLLLAAPAYSYGSIIARYRETHLRGFCLPRTCYDLFLSFSTSTPDVMEKWGPTVVINDLFTNRTTSTIIEYLSNLYKKTCKVA